MCLSKPGNSNHALASGLAGRGASCQPVAAVGWPTGPGTPLCLHYAYALIPQQKHLITQVK